MGINMTTQANIRFLRQKEVTHDDLTQTTKSKGRDAPTPQPLKPSTELKSNDL